jgi:hypothetical protein
LKTGSCQHLRNPHFAHGRADTLELLHDLAHKVRVPIDGLGQLQQSARARFIDWRRSRKGYWALGMKTRKARQRRAITSIDDWCQRHRHWPAKAQHATLTRKLNGHYNYFAIAGNNRCIAALDDWGAQSPRRHEPERQARSSHLSRMIWRSLVKRGRGDYL